MQIRSSIISSAGLFLLACLLFAGAPAKAQEEVRTHIVKDLDNYFSLSLKYDVSIEDLKLANPGISSPKPGDVLVIPQKGLTVEEPAKTDCSRLRKKRSEFFRVALMIPLYLEQVEDSLWHENLIPAKVNDLLPFRFIQFYQGFMLAMDSLKQQGLNVEVYVYDVDQQAEKVINVLQKPELKTMDMIFGPFSKNSFSMAAEFAKRNRIPIINPLSGRNDILQGNPFVFKLLPSVESQPEVVAALISHYYMDHRVIFYVPNKYQNFELIGRFRQAIERSGAAGHQGVTIIDYATDSIQGFYDHASLTEPNLVIIYAESEVLPAALLSQLSELKKEYDITVIGLPDSEKFNNIESGYLIALNTNLFMASHADNQSETVKAFIRSYRSKYLDEPLNYAYSGFDAGYFFLSALLYYGKNFDECINEIKVTLIQNQYHFIRMDNNGYDNINWNILQYNGYSLLKKSSF